MTPEALILAALNDAETWPGELSIVTFAARSAAELRRLHAENETLRAGYDAARLEIATLHAQLEAVGVGGVGSLMAAPAQAAEPDFDDCAESPTGKHSASWFSNDNCEYCNTGEVSAPLYYAPSEMQLTPQEQEHVATVQCVRGVTIGYLEKMLPIGTKLYTAHGIGGEK